jgi:hypothetical protein
VIALYLQRFDEAANSFYEGVKLDPENKELVKSFRYVFKSYVTNFCFSDPLNFRSLSI